MRIEYLETFHSWNFTPMGLKKKDSKINNLETNLLPTKIHSISKDIMQNKNERMQSTSIIFRPTKQIKFFIIPFDIIFL